MGKIFRWKVLWSGLEGPHSWKRVSGPLGALVCYLKELGVQGEQLDAWVFPKVSSRHTFPGDRGLPLPFEPRNPEDTFGIEKALAKRPKTSKVLRRDESSSLGTMVRRRLLQRSFPPNGPGFLVRGGTTRLLGRDAFWQGGRNGGAHPGEGFLG